MILLLQMKDLCVCFAVQIPLDRVKEEWERTNGPYHIQRLAEHYGIYRDLFPMAFFVPRVMMHVHYGDDASTAVYYGNQLPAATVRFKGRHRLRLHKTPSAKIRCP